MVKQRKKPLVSAILNFVLWGVGYIYNGKKIGFGALLLIAALLTFFISYSALDITFWFITLILDFAFAYDGYKEAKEINREK